MENIGISLFVLTVGLVGATDLPNRGPEIDCKYFEVAEGTRAAHRVARCADLGLTSVPKLTDTDFETFDLQKNHIGALDNNSFAKYPRVKRLLLGFNRVHTVKPGWLAKQSDLETLNLTQNALGEVPAGLPASLRQLYMNGNSVKDVRHLANVSAGLRVFGIKECDLIEYPKLGLMPGLVEVDASDNNLTELDPVQLAGTCRLTKLNVMGNARLFKTARSYCKCSQVNEWAATRGIKVLGLDADDCPKPRYPSSVKCPRISNAAYAAYNACMDARRIGHDTAYWAICSWAAVLAGLLLALYLYWRQWKRNRGNEELTVNARFDPNDQERTTTISAVGNRG